MSTKIEKRIVKSKAVSTKVTEEQNEKLELLAQQKGVTKSSLISQLLAIGFVQASKYKSF